MGQGARTIFAQIVAEEFVIPVERVGVVMGDTATVPYDQQTSASRSTVYMGRAIQRACQDVKRQIADADCDTRDEVIGVGEAHKDPDPSHPLGGTAAFFEFNATAVEVQVDRDTGDVTVTRHVTVSDVGKALNPMQVRGQDEGAAVMGLGHTLMERLILDDDGRIRNLGAIDYKIPTTMDLPQRMESDIVENEDGPGPYGAKGMSEGALLPVAPAVAAAVFDAVGVRFRVLPLSPERVWRAIRAADIA
jgi:CO/xanthine dehydrogenase Mo-binding subunit